MDKNKGVVKAGNRVEIRLLKGEVECEQVDVIVNETNNKLQLKYGAVSARILKAGGHQHFKDEIDVRCPSWNLDAGNIVVTPAPPSGKLRCRYIYHVTTRSDIQKDEKTQRANVKTALAKCLLAASEAQQSCIAIPPLGVASRNYDERQKISDAMFKEIFKFQTANSTSTLRYVFIVIHPEDSRSWKAFNEEYKKLSKTGKQGDQRVAMNAETTQINPINDPRNPGTSSHQASGPPVEQSKYPRAYQTPNVPVGVPPQTQISQMSVRPKDDSHGKMATYSEPHQACPSASPNTDYFTIPTNTGRNVKLVVCGGNILESQCDAIVHATNPMFEFKGSVGKQIDQHTQGMCKQSCAKAAKRGNGIIKITTEQHFKFKYILHLDVQSWTYQRPDGWIDTILTCLHEADRTHGISSVAFPLLGSGNMGLPVNVAVDNFYNACTQFGTMCQNIREIDLVLFSVEDVQRVQEQLRHQSRNPVSRQTHF